MLHLRKFQDDELSTQFNNIVENVYEYVMSSPTQLWDTTKGTIFGAFNSVTGYFQNVREYKDEESKFKSIMNGTALIPTQAAFDLCVAYAKNGSNTLN